MRLHRFYVQQPLGEELHIDEKNLVHQWSSVFRYKAGDSVLLFSLSPLGFDFKYRIISLSKKEAVLAFEEKTTNLLAKKERTLYMALVKKDTFETIARQATELMVTTIVPIVAERSEKKNLNIERLESIVKEAVEQCGRGDIPTILPISSFIKESEKIDANHAFFDKSGEGASEKEIDAVWIGPEGGWSNQELEIAKNKKASLLSLGESILKADTAAISALTKISLI